MNTNKIRQSELIRGFAAFILILSVFVQALIPTGWVPNSLDADGRLTLGICSTAGNETLNFGVPAESNRDNADSPASSEDHRLDQACPYVGAINVAVFESSLPFISFASQFDAASFSTVPQTSVITASTGAPVGSRAPPALS